MNERTLIPSIYCQDRRVRKSRRMTPSCLTIKVFKSISNRVLMGKRNLLFMHEEFIMYAFSV